MGDGAPSSRTDVDDFGAFFTSRYRDAYRLALLLTGGERAPAEDAVSEAFAQVFPKWRRGSVRNLDAYLRQAITNQVRTAFRRRQRERRDQPRVVESRNYDDRIADRERLWNALRALPPKQRAAVVLRYYADLSEADTARALGTSVGTVKAHVSRGLRRLETLLGWD